MIPIPQFLMNDPGSPLFDGITHGKKNTLSNSKLKSKRFGAAGNKEVGKRYENMRTMWKLNV
jgi:hypothetical protein